MLIIRCFDIASNLFLSRLDLERKTKPGTSLQALKKPPSLLSVGRPSTNCGSAPTGAILLFADGSEGC